jgi:hypothetical protein
VQTILDLLRLTEGSGRDQETEFFSRNCRNLLSFPGEFQVFKTFLIDSSLVHSPPCPKGSSLGWIPVQPSIGERNRWKWRKRHAPCSMYRMHQCSKRCISASRRGHLVEATSVSQQRACLCSSGFTGTGHDRTIPTIPSKYLQILANLSSILLLETCRLRIYIFPAFVAVSTTQQPFCPSNRFFLGDCMRAVAAFWNHDKETI